MAGPPPRFPQLHDEGWLREAVERGHNTVSLAAELGCSDAATSVALKRAGLSTKGNAGPTPGGPARLVARLLEQGLDPDATATAARLALVLDEGAASQGRFPV
jgi:hypothetical protein